MIKDYLFRIFRPDFWIQVAPTNEALSAKIERAIDSESPVTIVDEFTIKMAGMELWVENYPYGYGGLHNSPLSELPTARVRAKLKKYITEAVLKEITND